MYASDAETGGGPNTQGWMDACIALIVYVCCGMNNDKLYNYKVQVLMLMADSGSVRR